MDYILGLPCKHREYDLILVVVDKFSKVVHFIPYSKTKNASHVIQLFSRDSLIAYFFEVDCL